MSAPRRRLPQPETNTTTAKLVRWPVSRPSTGHTVEAESCAAPQAASPNHLKAYWAGLVHFLHLIKASELLHGVRFIFYITQLSFAFSEKTWHTAAFLCSVILPNHWPWETLSTYPWVSEASFSLRILLWTRHGHSWGKQRTRDPKYPNYHPKLPLLRERSIAFTFSLKAVRCQSSMKIFWNVKWS